MPFLDAAPELTAPRTPDGVAPPAPRDPTMGETFGAAFRADNPLVNLYRAQTKEAFPPVDGYNPMDEIRGTNYEAMHAKSFTMSQSPAETGQIKAQIDREEEDRKILEASGGVGFVAGVAAGIIDPTLALPGGVVFRSVKGGYSVSRSAVSVGIAAAGQTAVQEGVLQATQETRTMGESVAAVASSAILGGLIGSGAAGLLTRAERSAMERALDIDRLAIDAHATGQPIPASAVKFEARADDPNIFDYEGGSAVDRFGSKGSFAVRQVSETATVSRGTFEAQYPESAAGKYILLRSGENNTSGTLAESGVFVDKPSKPKFFDTAEEAQAAARGAVEPPLSAQTTNTGGGGFNSAGAAATDTRQMEMFKTPLDWTAQVSTTRRALQAEAVEARRVMADLAETPYRFVEGDAGVAATQGPALDRLARMEMNGTRVAIADNLDQMFADYRFGQPDMSMPRLRSKIEDFTGSGEGKMSFADFKKEVSLALQSGDQHAIPQVAQAAQFIRSKLLAPWADRAEKAIEGFSKIEPAAGEGYFPHVWNKQIIKARRPEFTNRLVDLYSADQTTKRGIQERVSAFKGALDVAEGQIEKHAARIKALSEDVDVVQARQEEAQRLNKFAFQRAGDLRAADVPKKENARGGAVFETKVRGRSNDLADRASGKLAEIDKLERIIETELANARSMRAKIEAELGRWEGKSTVEAKSALKAREAADAARSPEAKAKKPRLESADPAIDRAVKKILESDRNLSVEELRAQASQTVDRIIGSSDGRLPYDLATGGPRIGHQREPMPRGALAGRSLNVTNAWAREWIENDVEQVVAMHLRTVVPDVLLSERFGDVEMTQSFRKIEDSYSRLIDATKSEKERVRLGKERDAVIRDVAAVRDRVRGVYGWSPELANMARIANSAKAINNLTSMGSAALSSIPDMAGVVFRYGFTTALRDGWTPFFKGLTSSTEEWGKFRSQMRAIGIGVETAINARQHSLDDVVDVYKPQSRVERVLQGASDKFFVANLLAPLTDAQKLIASHAAVSEIIRAARAAAEGKATKRQIGNLAESGIDAQMAGRIWREFGELKRGEVTDGVHLPNTADWKDKAAADALNGAVAREVDIAVVTPGQEKPLWMSKPVISLLGQFKAFTAAATERILVANLQRRDAAALSGVVFSVALGMLTYKVNSFFGGMKTSDRPQDWFKEGISRGGLLGWFEEGNALASKATRGSADIYRTIGADKPLSRFASRSAADMLLGPTWGKVESLPKITGALSSGEWSASDSSALRRLIPAQNLFWLRGLLNKVEESANAAAGVEPKPAK